MKRIALLIAAVLIVISFSSCRISDVYDKFHIHGTQDENGFSSSYYDKAYIDVFYGLEHDDIFSVRTANYPDDYSCILYGKFDKVSFNNGTMFILLDNKYYVFDVRNYDINKYSNSEEAKEYIKIYSETEFDKNYPDNQSFYWENG